MERYKNNTVGNSCIVYMRVNSKTQRIQNDIDMKNNKDNNSVEVMIENDLKHNNNNVENVGSILKNTLVSNEPIEVVSVTDL